MAIVEHMGKTFEIDEDGFIDAFESWKGSIEQVDDVVVIGVKF